MGLREALISFNEVKNEGIIQDYAIIGGYAVIYHAVPYSSYDLDIGIIVHDDDSYHKLHEHYRKKGNKIENVYIHIGGMPVQFFPNINILYNEVVERALKVTVANIPTKVATIEHLIVLALDAYRAKDKIRILQLLEKADKKLLDDIITRFDNKEGRLRARYKDILASSRESET